MPVPLGRRILLEKKIVAAAGAPTGGALALVPTIEAVLYGSLVTDGAWAFAELDGARLERALVRLLATYPMLAGTFEAATSAVVLNNAGVRYSRYRQPGSFTIAAKLALLVALLAAAVAYAFASMNGGVLP